MTKPKTTTTTTIKIELTGAAMQALHDMTDSGLFKNTVETTASELLLSAIRKEIEKGWASQNFFSVRRL